MEHNTEPLQQMYLCDTFNQKNICLHVMLDERLQKHTNHLSNSLLANS